MASQPDNFPEHTLPDQILDAVPELYELNRYVRIRKWYDLGIELKLDNVDLAASKNHTDVYQLWLDEKSLQATRRNLIDALRAIGQNRVVDKYIAYLKTIKMDSEQHSDKQKPTTDPPTSVTNVPAPQSNTSTTNVLAPQSNPNATPLFNVSTIVTDETRKDFDTQVKMQHDDKRVGLVVIMGVVNQHGPQGTDIDIGRVKETFEGLNFATWVIKDPTPNKVREAVKLVIEYNFPLGFKGVIVYYAGHGGSYNNQGFFILPSADDKTENFFVDGELIALFQPKNKECRLANRYRLFLFDCCLIVANPGATPQTIVQANPNLPRYQPEVDYTLVAHATYERQAAGGTFSSGGVWTHYLCNNIQLYANTKTIGAILEITRNDVIRATSDRVQAPFYKSMGGDVMLLQGIVQPPPPSPSPPPPPPPPPDIDIENIMDAIPEKSDLMTVLDGIKDDKKKWRDLFGKRLLKDAKKGDPWFRNFTELAFLIDEITGENADNYIYTWGSVINSLDEPTIIKIGSNRAGFKPVSDVVRDHLNNRDVYDKYMH